MLLIKYAKLGYIDSDYTHPYLQNIEKKLVIAKWTPLMKDAYNMIYCMTVALAHKGKLFGWSEQNFINITKH